MNSMLAVAVTPSGSSRALWYFTRGFGVAALVMLTGAVLLGVLTSVRWGPRRLPRFVVDGLHRNISMLSIAFLSVHVATAVLDGFAPIGWLDAVVPLHSAYRPVWLGLGAVATDLLLAVAATSLARVWLGHRTWRFVHWLAYACWPLALVHGVGTGSDGGREWMLVLDASAVASVVAAAWWRGASGWPSAAPVRVGAAALSVVGPIVMAIWMIGGPMQPGWARAAGTPAQLLAHRGKVVATHVAVATPKVIRPFTAALDGTFHQGSPSSDGRIQVELRADVARSTPLVFDAILEGRVGTSGGLVVERGAIALGTAAEPVLYRGALTSLQGGRLGATLSDNAGHRLDVDVSVKTGARAGTITGEMHAERAAASGRDNEASETGNRSEAGE